MALPSGSKIGPYSITSLLHRRAEPSEHPRALRRRPRRERALPRHRDLKRIDIATGVTAPIAGGEGVTLAGTWSRSGAIVFGSANGLWQVPASGGTPSKVMDLAPGEAFLNLPMFLPDDEHLLLVTALGDEVRVVVDGWAAALRPPAR